jgi:hypothetical protein
MSLGFDLYEDPNTSTAGMWNGENIFDNEVMLLGMDDNSKRSGMDTGNGPDAVTLLKMNVGGMTVDFAAMIEEVVGTATKDTDGHENQGRFLEDSVRSAHKSPEAESEGVGGTPEEPTSV